MGPDKLIDSVLQDLIPQLTTPTRHSDSPATYEPRTKIIDREILACAAIIQGVDRKIAALKKHRDSVVQVNDLPQDIVLLVFAAYLEDLRGSLDYYKQLFLLRSVCTAWHSFINNYPLFWTPIFPDHKIPLHKFTISKTRNLPLEILFPAGDVNDQLGDISRNASCHLLLSTVVLEHLPVKALHLHLNPLFQQFLLLPYLAQPAPHMESLELAYPVQIEGAFFSGVAPSLRCVRLTRVTLLSTAQPFTQLRELQLSELQGLNIPRLLRLLHRCPALEHLVLRSTNLTEGAVTSQAPSSVALPKLRTLSLQQLEGPDTNRILQALSVPATTYRALFSSSPASPLQFSTLLERLVAILPGSNGPHMEMRGGSQVALGIRVANWSIMAPVTRPPNQILDAWFQDVLSHLPVSIRSHVTSFTIRSSNQLLKAWLSIVDKEFPSLLELALDTTSIGGGNTLSWTLGDPKSRWPYRGPIWSFPELRSISVIADGPPLSVDVVQALTRALRGRAQSPRGPAAITSVTFKLPRGVYIPPDVSDAIEQVRCLVPSVRVVEIKQWTET